MTIANFVITFGSGITVGSIGTFIAVALFKAAADDSMPVRIRRERDGVWINAPVGADHTYAGPSYTKSPDGHIVDLATARAFQEAGYLSNKEYLDIVGEEQAKRNGEVC